MCDYQNPTQAFRDARAEIAERYPDLIVSQVYRGTVSAVVRIRRSGYFDRYDNEAWVSLAQPPYPFPGSEVFYRERMDDPEGCLLELWSSRMRDVRLVDSVEEIYAEIDRVFRAVD
jgi:hypothetical protein